jgi:hypothetical protein
MGNYPKLQAGFPYFKNKPTHDLCGGFPITGDCIM